MIYEYITPSDPVTFIAFSDKIALIVSIIIGNGKAGCMNVATGESLPSLLMFEPDPKGIVSAYLEKDPDAFIAENKECIASAFDSFAYGSVSDRAAFDHACSCITDKGKLLEFKKSHENKNRTSMNKIVQAAWDYAEELRNQEQNNNG